MLLEGKPVAEEIYEKINKKICELKSEGVIPHLAIVLVGHREDSELFVKLKEKEARKLGMEFSAYKFEEDEPEVNIIETIRYLNNDSDIHGIIVQLPLPEGFDTDKILNTVDLKKDVDGLRNNSPYCPPAPEAILELLKHYKIDLNSKKIVILGKGRLIGQPLEKILRDNKLNVEALDKSSGNLIERIRQADILIAGTGSDGIITEDLVNKNMVVVDAANDVNFGRVEDKVEAVTPPIGGIGPITVALLLANTVKAAEAQSSS